MPSAEDRKTAMQRWSSAFHKIIGLMDFLMFCLLCVIVYQYSGTNVMHFLFNLLRIKGLYMFRALLAHPQEALNKRHLLYCVRVVSWLQHPILVQWSVPLGTDHCSSEEYRCTHVDACVARTRMSYRCVPCHPWCTHRTSLVVKKFSVFLWLWTIPLR
jgi:hypothetical protein